MKKLKPTFIVFLILFTYVRMNAQFKDFGIKGGLQTNGVLSLTEFEDDNGFALASYLFRAFLRLELSNSFNAELGAGYGMLNGDDFNYSSMKKGTGEYSTKIIPIDARLLITPWDLENWNPYLYGGIGLVHYSVNTKPSVTSIIKVEESGWTAIIPFGIGAEIKLNESFLLDLSAGFNYSLTDNFNYFSIDEFHDTYFNIGIGITIAGGNSKLDKDGDGLTQKEEEELGTDPLNPDTDGDGLKDGSEIKQYRSDPKNPDSDGDTLKDGEEVLNYKTDPNKVDTDNDGLKDGDEVNVYKTEPLNADTDQDGLKDNEEVLVYKTNATIKDTDLDSLIDGEEVLKHKTDPLKLDTDGDGLNDGEEVKKYNTDPVKPDTDEDGLKDGEEVLKFNTDPLVKDTDKGSVNDGIEVKRGSNPKDPSDDVVKTGATFILEGITFDTNSDHISPDSETILNNGLNTLNMYSDIKVEIGGHTDNSGSRALNMDLSLRRANAVKSWLELKGIASERMTTKGYGPDKPRVPNTSMENMKQNRRIEFTVVD
jgi:outer membrane protein OmpA-like peptidoglycan-associated protein